MEDRALGHHVWVVFRCWVVLFAPVGARMGWVLRPFVGAPGEPVQFFRGGDWEGAYVVVARLIWEAVAR